MRTISVALATALLFWAGILLKAQPLKQVLIPGSFKEDTAHSTDSFHTKKAAYRKHSFQHPSATLGHPAGKKLAGHSKRESDSLQQIILLRKKF